MADNDLVAIFFSKFFHNSATNLCATVARTIAQYFWRLEGWFYFVVFIYFHFHPVLPLLNWHWRDDYIGNCLNNILDTLLIQKRFVHSDFVANSIKMGTRLSCFLHNIGNQLTNVDYASLWKCQFHGFIPTTPYTKKTRHRQNVDISGHILITRW